MLSIMLVLLACNIRTWIIHYALLSLWSMPELSCQGAM